MNYEVPYLKHQLERARAILFTGAGFSFGAKNITGQPLPLATDLKMQIWKLTFPDHPYDPASQLQSVYEAACRRCSRELKDLLTSALSVDGKSLPSWFHRYFVLPWAKIYTLNIDDLPARVQANTWLPRKLEIVSAITGRPGTADSTAEKLAVVFLNGILAEAPNGVTFSLTQYAQRISQQDPFYASLASELLTMPFVFIGTNLEESTLWQHLELRKQRGGGGEMRPKSFLITPTIDKAREVTLSQFNITWVPMTAERFSEEVLAQLESTTTEGLSTTSKKAVLAANEEIADLAVILKGALKENRRTDYLLGREPEWIDIHSGRAIERDIDKTLWQVARGVVGKPKQKGCILISGTAGSGKSSSLMRLAMRLSFEGKRVGWIDRDHEASVWTIRKACKQGANLDVLAIDDADLLGYDLAATVREICADRPFPLVVMAIRSGRIDRFLNPAQLGDTEIREEVMPTLTDSDIAGLIATLTEDNKLGRLRGLPSSEQERLFREKAGRELLVAMIEATSGERFEDKAVREFEDLDALKQKIYAIAATAAAQEFRLRKADMLMALGSSANNETLNAIDQLVKRNILNAGEDGQTYRPRHRVIGELIQNKLQNSGQLYEVVRGLLTALATHIQPGLPNYSKPKKLLARLTNHKLLHHLLGPEHARTLYCDLEVLLKDESHYWLQRGILEVEAGNLRLAKNWLDQAKGINPTDDYVEVEYALWQFRTAIESPHSASAPDLVCEAVKSLDHQITINGAKFAHAYHVLGSQAISWIRRSSVDFSEKRVLLLHALDQVKAGVANHPRNEQLLRLHKELEDERFNLVMR